VKVGAELSVTLEHELFGAQHYPPPRGQIPWLLPDGRRVLQHYQEDTDGKLFDALVEYHRAISELPSEAYYDLLAAWTLHTYWLEAVHYSPILCFFAIAERGKTRTGKGLIYIAHRGIHVQSLRDPYLVRVAKYFQASLFFDVMDIWEEARKEGSADILLGRFEKGLKVPRVLYPDKGPFNDMVYYEVFGPTIIATNEPIHRILETRCLYIKMPETTRRFEAPVRPELALPLKERLVAFRARHLGESLPAISKPTSGRLGDILQPLQQLIRVARPEREQAFLALVRELEQQTLIEKADTLEAELLRTVASLEHLVKGGLLPNKLIADTYNKERPERTKVSYTKVGKRLSALGFEKAVLADGASAIRWDQDKNQRLCEKYGLRNVSDPSVSSAQRNGSTAGSEASDGLPRTLEPPDPLNELQISDEELVRRRNEYDKPSGNTTHQNGNESTGISEDDVPL